MLTPLAKSALTPLELTAATLATDAGIQKKILGSRMLTVIFCNEDLYDIMEIVKSREDVGFLIKGISETVENEVKNENEDFLVR